MAVLREYCENLANDMRSACDRCNDCTKCRTCQRLPMRANLLLSELAMVELNAALTFMIWEGRPNEYVKRRLERLVREKGLAPAYLRDADNGDDADEESEP
jgi:hypothetical protein